MAPRMLLLLAALLPALPAGAATHAACPENLVATAAGPDTIALDWDAAPGAVAYNVYRAMQGERLTVVGGVLAPQTDYVDQVQAKGRYRYMVTGYDELLGESRHCEVATVDFPPMP